jgi:prefoldin subunit 5
MKKGLLSILAGALLVVGCQNYDDQFDSLEQQINALAAQASAITQVQSDLSALATQVSGLAGQLSAADLASVTSQVDAIKTQIDGLATVGEEVDNLNEEVDEILEILGELLQANAVINQKLKISNEAELEYVESLIGTEADDPTVIINGGLEVDNSNLSTAALAARVDAVVAKVRTVIGAVTIVASATVDASTLGFIDGTATIDNGVDISALATVSGAVSLGHYGDIDLSQLVSVGSLTLSQSVSITSLNIGNMTGTLNTKNYPNALTISLGDIALTGQVTATLATSFTWGFNDDQATNLSITVSGVAKVFANSLPSISGVVTLTNSGDGSEGHFGALKTIATGGSLVNPAKTIAMSAITTVSGTLTANGPSSIDFPELATQGGAISVSNAATFLAPKLIDNASITTSSTAAITLKSVSSTVNLTASPTIEGLTVTAQATSLDLGLLPGLKTAVITGGGSSSSAIAVSVNASSTVLGTLTVDGVLNTLTIDTAPALKTLATAGEITDFTVSNSATMTTIDFGHTFISGDTAATVTVSGVAELKSLDMSSLTKVKTVNVVNNAALASIVAPSSTVLAEPIAAISVTLNGNKLTGGYTQAVEGAETKPYSQAAILSDDLATFKTFIEAYAAQSDRVSSTSVSATSGVQSITYSMNIDVVTIDATSTATATLQAALVSNTAAQKGLDKSDNTADDATDAAGAGDAASTYGVSTKNELDLVTTE